MKMKVAIAGLGARGYHTYAQYQNIHPDEMQIVAIADVDKSKIKLVKEKFSVDEKMCFSSAEEMLSKDKLADVVFIATQDGDHLAHSLMALDKGYDILLEKPIASRPEDCIKLRDKVIETGRLVVVCHVLRYAEFYTTIKKVIDDKTIGEVVTVHAIENVGYWHHAHSFVRGNWSDSNKTSPMILQKCCHDFDIISYLTGKKCLSISSYGSLKHFNAKNKPEGAASRCLECKYKDECQYSAVKIYLDNSATGFRKGNTGWPCDVVAEQPTEEKLLAALKTGPYGRCVYACDNNVVDHQVVGMNFEDEVTAVLTMSAFTRTLSRNIKIMGTKGEIEGDQESNIIKVTRFGEEPVIYDINKLAKDLSGHGGGDNRLIAQFFDSIKSKTANASSTIVNSMQSHIMAFAAEYSRVNGGQSIDLRDFEKLIVHKN